MTAGVRDQVTDTDVSDMPSRLVRLGTRASALARAQSGLIAAELEKLLGCQVELVDIRTTGDDSPRSLRDLGGTGVFVSALREALHEGRIDCAVHSLKDLPTTPMPGITLAAIPPREDPRDVLVTASGGGLDDLPAGARVGTGSPRRAAFLAQRDLTIVDIRGNVDTRLARVGHDLDAVVLAAAGLRRLGRAGVISQYLDTESFPPAPGQGALAIETRADDQLGVQLAGINDVDTQLAVTAERALLAALEAGCSAPVGALARVIADSSGQRLTLTAAAGDTDGTVVRATSTVALSAEYPHASPHLAEAVAAGQSLAEELRGLMKAQQRDDRGPKPEAEAK